MPTCSVQGCERTAHLTRGWCKTHYKRWARHGDPLTVLTKNPTHMPEAQAFWRHVDQNGSCWLWTGFVSPDGYGRWRQQGAHRVAYRLSGLTVPEGLQLDHLCRVRHCVRPTHLEPVTCRVNILRGIGASAINARKRICKNGHPLAGANVYTAPSGTTRRCVICKREYMQRYHRNPA